MKLTKIILVFLMTINFSYGMKKDEIKNEMTKKIDSVTLILKDKNSSKEDKFTNIVKVVDDIFDYSIMSRIALGSKVWKKLSKNKKDDFVKVFEKKLKNSYIDKLDFYTNQDIKIVELKPYKKKWLQLESHVIGDDETYKIKYNFYKNKKTKEWLVFDIDLAGVSVVKTYKKQFYGQLKEKSFDELIAALKK